MKKSFQHLDFIIDLCGKTQKHFDKRKDLSSVQLVCIGLLERLSHSSLALKTLLKEIDSNRSLEYACGIILRSMLLDALIVLNVYNILLENEASEKTLAEKEQTIKEFCDTSLSDGLENTLQYLCLAKKFNIINQDELGDRYKNLVDGKSSFFEPYTDKSKQPMIRNDIEKPDRPIKLFKKIASKEEFKKLARVYDSYLFYSKYDHFGILYYEISRQPYPKQLKRIREEIEFFILIQSILHDVLFKSSNSDTFLCEQSRKANNYLKEEVLIPSPE